MAWRLVKQPNGLIARFSDIVDHFTHANMDEALVASELCDVSPDVVADKLLGAAQDDVWGKVEQTDGFNRWRESLATIRAIHGEEHVVMVDQLGRDGMQ